MNICAELRPRIVAFLDGELTDAEAATVASHLEACDECRAERRTIVATRELLGEIPAPAPSPDAWKRIRREIRPAPRVSRAWNAPVPMWAVGSMAAGFLGLAVLFNTPEAGRTVVDNGGEAAQPSDEEIGNRVAKPTAPEFKPERKPDIDTDVTQPKAPESAGGGTEPQTPPEDGLTPPQSPESHVPTPKTSDPLSPADPAEETGPTQPAPPEDDTPENPGSAGVSRPVGPSDPSASTPVQAQWESVQLSPIDAPKLPQTPAFAADARAFHPGKGLPVPRGEALVQVRELEKGDLLVDRGGEGKSDHYFTISRRLASRSGVTFPLRVQHGKSGPAQWLRVTVLKDGDTWLFRNLTARRGKWLGRTVVVLDGNHNGAYDDAGKDVVIFGKRAEVVPVSDVLLTDGGLTEFGVDPVGGRFRVRPYSGPTGTVSLDAAYNGSGRASSVIVNSGDHYFEIAGRKGAIAVPAGTYTVATGLMVSKHARMKILPGSFDAVEVATDDAEASAIVLGGQCAMEYGLDGDPQEGWVSVAVTSIAVRGGSGELYEPLGKGLTMVSFQLRDGEGRLLKQQKAAPSKCPKNDHARFGVKLPNSVKRVSDVSVTMFAPAYEKTFGSVTGTNPEKRR